MGLPEASDNSELLGVFSSLYEKNAKMKQFVSEVREEVEELEAKIERKKEDIQRIYVKGSGEDDERMKLNLEQQKKYDLHQKKQKVLEMQLEKSTNTIDTIKKYLEGILEEVGVDSEVVERLKNCTFNEENITEFLG